ncbi:MAG: penicillin-binding protein 2 [Armatimonadetes bacterium]|nr:penicillin-binding protein 2 [Anaerolineae bacterium]
MQSAQPISVQQQMLHRRLPLVVGVLLFFSGVLVTRLVLFQAPQDPAVATYIQRMRDASYGTTQRITAARGIIYDRNGQPMAVNTLLYRIGISPRIVSDTDAATQSLAAILNRDPLEIAEILNSGAAWKLLATNLEPEIWRKIDELDLTGITSESIPRRYYPQGKLASQVIGFVGGEGDTFRGYLGTEDYYQSQLAGRTRNREVSNIPFDVPQNEERLDRGADLVLTLDRDIQFLAEAELQLAVEQYAAQSGTIIVMNPRTGDILAMVSYPAFDPNDVLNVEDERVLKNPAISEIYEPGSVFKVLTVAAALQQGTITPSWTYNDTGTLDIGGIAIQNWDKRAYGVVDVEQILVNSLNIGVATISGEMGIEKFYPMMLQFGIGQRTGVDLQGEVEGVLRIPNRDADWQASDLGANSYGQGVAVTPLQMLTAVNAIANGGLMMQPRIALQIVQGEDILNLEPRVTGRPISAEVAKIVTEMMVAVVEDGLDEQARLTGYTVAGKTGTAQIANALGQYDETSSIMTFIGFLPADDPQISILVKLDRPKNGNWASSTAAPVFRRLAEQLVLMLEIPTDDVRYQLAAQGGVIGGIDR